MKIPLQFWFAFKILISVFVLFVLLVNGYYGTAYYKKVAEYKKLGVGFEQSLYMPPTIPDKDNASLILDECITEYMNSRPGVESYIVLNKMLAKEEMTEEDWSKNKEILAKDLPKYQKLSKAFLCKKASYLYRFQDILHDFRLSSAANMPIFGRQVLAKVVVANSLQILHDGNPIEAYKEMEKAFLLVKFCIEEHPSMLSFSAGGAITGLTCRAIEKMENISFPTAEQQSRFNAIINKIHWKEQEIKSLHYEIASNDWDFLRQKKVLHPLEKIPVFFFVYYYACQTLIPQMEFYKTVLEFGNKPLCDSKTRLDEIVTKMNMTTLTQESDHENDRQESLVLHLKSTFVEPQIYTNLMQLSFTIGNSKVENGACPETLEEIKQKWEGIFPLDPYSGNELKYKKNNDGFIVYSVYKDCVDDGGTAYPENLTNTQEGDFSITRQLFKGDLAWQVCFQEK